jgi:phosphopantothenate---cysteine ligase (ATP)
MDQVPKILKPMVDEWSREGFIVSFKVNNSPHSTNTGPLMCLKLETDPSILISKAQTSLRRYGHQVVIGNDLNRRKFEVVLISQPLDQDAISGDNFAEQWIRIDLSANPTKEIEEDIVADLVGRHRKWIEATT